MKEAQVILDRLLEKYEKSRHLTAPGTSRRRVMLQINKNELPGYNYENASVRDAYNAAAKALEMRSLVQLEWARDQMVLSAIVLNLDQIMLCYAAAERLHPRERAEHFAALVSQKLADSSVSWVTAWRDDVCKEAREHLKLPAFCRENEPLLEDLLTAFQRYAELTDSITMRCAA